jgi:hypothetical protein
MLSTETIAVYSDTHKKPINTPHGKHAEILTVKAGDTLSIKGFITFFPTNGLNEMGRCYCIKNGKIYWEEEIIFLPVAVKQQENKFNCPLPGWDSDRVHSKLKAEDHLLYC